MSEQGVAPAGDAPISAREAAAIISSPPPAEKKPDTEAAAPVQEDKAAAPAQESAPEADAGPAQEPVPGETEEVDPAAEEQPSIEPPRSWSKEHKEHFEALPRHIQQAISDNERAREADFNQKTRAAAEAQKAIEAREQAAEQARQHYEQALPQLLLQIDGDYQRKFGNVSWETIEGWTREGSPNYEPTKYLEWRASYDRLQAVAGEARQQQQQQLQKAESDRLAFIDRETKLLAEKVPELADQKAMDAKRGEYLSFLGEVGFTHDELAYHAKSLSPSISIHDHRLTVLIDKAKRFDEAQRAAKKAAPKEPVPPVQRPGSPPAKGEAKQARLKELGTQLERSHSAKDAAKLIAALG